MKLGQECVKKWEEADWIEVCKLHLMSSTILGIEIQRA